MIFPVSYLQQAAAMLREDDPFTEYTVHDTPNMPIREQLARQH